MKKTIFILMLLMAAMVSASAQKKQATGKSGIIFRSGNLHYKILSKNTCEVTQLVTTIRDKTVIIPQTVTHKKVKYNVIGLGFGALSNDIRMTEVYFPPKLQYISKKAGHLQNPVLKN